MTTTMPEKIIYFDGPETINALFAGNQAGNLKATGKYFGAAVTTRDNWMKIASDDEAAVDKALGFFDELLKVHESGHSLHQRDFDLILSATRGRLGLSAHDLYAERIKVSPKKADIVPRTATQYEYIKSIRQHDVVMGVGPAGTGKTYLAMAMAVSAFLCGGNNRIVLTRPALEAGETLGFLPGTLEEKIKPYLRPLYDALYDMLEADKVAALVEKGIIEIAPLAYMRGRTLNNAFIILDEAQNTTAEQMLMFLTRIGFDSKCVVTGDPSQTDLPSGQRSGLVDALAALKRVEEIVVCQFTSRDVVRNSLIEKIILAYEQHGTTGRQDGGRSRRG